jgi:pyruvate kinase
VQVIERILTKGTGIGEHAIQGQIRLIEGDLPSRLDIKASDVLVAKQTTRELVSVAQKAAGLVVVTGGTNSHAAQMAIDLGLTAIFGARDAFSTLEEGQTVTLDPNNGIVYEGLVKR